MTQKCKQGLFVTINSVDHLTRVIANANMHANSFRVFDEDNSWADGIGKRYSGDDSGDDMGFDLFD